MDESAPPPRIVETHLSTVIFVGDRAYKVKKPLDLGFADFTTRQAREAVCHRELELNRRLAPDVYLGVLDVVRDGETVDHLLEMIRLPAHRRLATLVVEGDPDVPAHLDRIGRLLADFHSRTERSEVIAEAGTVAAVAALWEDNLAGIEPFAGPDGPLDADTHRRVADLARRYVAGRGPLFEQRRAGGHVVDGHGDLQAADIFCMEDGPRILDCIEFNDRFRHGDVLADVAFLAMDLERLGAPDAAKAFLEAYHEHSAEQHPRSLLEHYLAYRAHVRCKVNCLRAAQATGDERDEATAEARRLLHTTERWLRAARVRLVLVGGSPGTGKSSLAQRLGGARGWTVLSSDEVRDEVVPARSDEESRDRYSEDSKNAVYAEMLARARVALCLGETVVLDASFGSDRWRAAARTVAGETGADLVEVRCTADTDTARARVARRLATGGDASEATPEVAERLAADFEPWPQATEVDTTAPPGEVTAAALAAVDA
jgi:uncharacterized protein